MSKVKNVAFIKNKAPFYFAAFTLIIIQHQMYC